LGRLVLSVLDGPVDAETEGGIGVASGLVPGVIAGYVGAEFWLGERDVGSATSVKEDSWVLLGAPGRPVIPGDEEITIMDREGTPSHVAVVVAVFDEDASFMELNSISKCIVFSANVRHIRRRKRIGDSF
jgi:hypothetical protein